MTQNSVERTRLTRDRRRRGVRPILVEVSQEIVEFLEVNGYLPDRSNDAIGAAVSRFWWIRPQGEPPQRLLIVSGGLAGRSHP
jgi:hypothetical protein